ncbi:hypothetical protein PYCC9005_001420 [Savitreella phatthalungensis]
MASLTIPLHGEDAQRGFLSVPRPRAQTLNTPVGTPADELQDYFAPKPPILIDAAWLWAHLPVEVKTHILSFLSTADKVRCMQVNQELRDIVSNGTLWQTLDTSSFYARISQAQLLRLIHRAAPFVQVLNLRGCTQLRDTASVQLTNLVNASFEGCRFFTTASLARLVGQNSRLQALDVSGLSAVNDSFLSSLCLSCSGLVALNINYCRNVSAQCLDTSIKRLSNLRDLRIAECRLTRPAMRSLNELSDLQRLSMSGSVDLRDEWIQDLIYGKHEYGLTFPEMRVRRPLVHLDLSRCRFLDGSFTRYLLGTTPNLEKLELAGFHQLRDHAIDCMAPYLTSLTHIDLSDNRITDSCLSSLARHCLKLRHVQVSHCPNVGDPGVLALIGALELTHLECDNTRISNNVLSAIAAKPCAMRLSIYDCPNVTWTGVLSILTANSQRPEHMTRLKTFYGWQRPVDGHTKRILRGEIAAAREVERAWARYMMDGSEEAMRAGATAADLGLLDFDEESTRIIGRERRRHSRSCILM